ncbi:MAG: transposase [Desulfovibrio sp.]|nr:transposase [Desulfovibrio sp.]
MDITNEQWERLAPLLPDTPKGPKGQGRPVLNEPRVILNAILWILRTSAPWKDLPERYTFNHTCFIDALMDKLPTELPCPAS